MSYLTWILITRNKNKTIGRENEVKKVRTSSGGDKYYSIGATYNIFIWSSKKFFSSPRLFCCPTFTELIFQSHTECWTQLKIIWEKIQQIFFYKNALLEFHSQTICKYSLTLVCILPCHEVLMQLLSSDQCVFLEFKKQTIIRILNARRYQFFNCHHKDEIGQWDKNCNIRLEQ